jgi:hypothetical protein
MVRRSSGGGSRFSVSCRTRALILSGFQAPLCAAGPLAAAYRSSRSEAFAVCFRDGRSRRNPTPSAKYRFLALTARSKD